MLLLDTSVWMDYFLARQRSHKDVAEIVALAQDSETVALCVSSHSLKDIAYLMASAMTAESRREGIDVTSEVGAAARETAWGCVRCIVDSALVVPVGRGEVLQAFTFKALHPDFEDDLLLDPLRQLVDEGTFDKSNPTRLEKASLGNDAGVVGAALLCHMM